MKMSNTDNSMVNAQQFYLAKEGGGRKGPDPD